jgi:hypothetical protein
MKAGQNCLLCHQNPTGGGMRGEYATQFLVPERLAMYGAGSAEAGDPPAPPNPRIGENLTIGVDVRTVHLTRDDVDSGNNFLQMQGSLYLNLELEPRVSLYVHEELGSGSARAYELYGLGFVLPATGYVKVGRFVPAFGWKRADHRAFTRREYVVFPAFPPQSDTGVEVGFLPGPFSFQFSATNGEFASARDANDELAWTARGEVRRDLGPAHAAIGGSYSQRRGVVGSGASAAGEDVWAGGPFAAVRWGRLTWLGEFDWAHREVAIGLPAREIYLSFTTSQELSVELRQGLDVVAVYDFHDVDFKWESGTLTRVGVGLDALLTPWLGARADLNFFRPEDGRDLVERGGLGLAPGEEPEDILQSVFQIHLLY